MISLGSILSSSTPLDLNGMTDWHSHILPGVDDGVRTLDEAISILSKMEQSWIRKVWLTPHIMEDTPNSTAGLRERFRELVRKYGGGVKLRLASENMIDGLFTERLATGDLLPIGENSDKLLVETSYFNPPMKFDKTIEDIKSAGYTPLVAHPERYIYVEDFEEYRRWKDMGCLLQLNLLSLGGHYGAKARQNALELLRNGMYDFAGTDLHRPGQLDHLRKLRIPKKLEGEAARLISNTDI